MGVHGLWKLLEPTGQMIPLETMNNKVLAIDVSMWLHQALQGMREGRGTMSSVAHLVVLFHRLCKLLFYKIRPVFVFDGGVPALKRQTMVARRARKANAKSEANKLRSKLLKTIAKTHAIQQISQLASNNDLASLGSLNLPGPSVEEDLFKLPPIALKKEETTSEEEEEDFVDEGESTEILDIHSIDLKGEEWKNLPPTVRHEILCDLLETRKHGSWRQLDSMPKKAPDFSDFQMSRLLKRRAVQTELEQAGNELAKNDLTLAQLGGLMNVEIQQLQTGRIAQENETNYVLLKKSSVTPKVNTVQDLVDILEDKVDEADEAVDIEEQRVIIESFKSEKSDDRLGVWKELCLIEGTQELEDSNVTESDFKFSVKNEESVKGIKEPNKVMEVFVAYDKKEEEAAKLSSESQETQTSQKENCDILDVNIENRKAHEEVYTKKSGDNVDENLISIKETKEKSNVSVIYQECLGDDKGITTSPSTEDRCDTFQSLENIDVDDKCKNSVANDLSDTNEQREGVEIMGICDKVNADLEVSGMDTGSKNMNDEIRENMKEQQEEIHSASDKDSSFKEEQSAIEESSCRNQQEINDKIVKIASQNDEIKEKRCTKSGNETLEVEVSSDEDDFVPVDCPPSNVHFENKEEKQKLNREELESMSVQLILEQNELLKEQERQNRLSKQLTDQMCIDVQELLRLFGVPWVVAPMEAEAQCAELEQLGLTSGTITDDSDIWLFGGRTVYRNFFDQKKHVLQFNADDISNTLNLTRQQLILLALLVGSDYTTGIQGIGPVTALEVLSLFRNPLEPLEGLREFRHWVENGFPAAAGRTSLSSKLRNVQLGPGFPSGTVYSAYLQPVVDSSKEPFSWAKPDLGKLILYTKRKFGWEAEQCKEVLEPVLKRLDYKMEQTNIRNYFKPLSVSTSHSLNFSKRVATAVSRLGQPGAELIPQKELKRMQMAERKRKAAEVLQKKRKRILIKEQPKEVQLSSESSSSDS